MPDTITHFASIQEQASGHFYTAASGKTDTSQVPIEEASNARWAVIVIDVEGEYVEMDRRSRGVTENMTFAKKMEHFEIKLCGHYLARHSVGLQFYSSYDFLLLIDLKVFKYSGCMFFQNL